MKQTAVQLFAGNDLLVDKNGQIPTLSLLYRLKLQKHKHSLIDFEVDFDNLLAHIFDLSQVEQFVLTSRFGGQSDKQPVLNDLCSGPFVVYFIVVVFFDEEFGDEYTELVFAVEKRQVILPLLLIQNLLLFAQIEQFLRNVGYVALQLFILPLQLLDLHIHIVMQRFMG